MADQLPYGELYKMRLELIRERNQLKAENEKLKEKIKGYDGGVLEPLRERYKVVCDENVQLQAELDKCVGESKSWRRVAERLEREKQALKDRQEK